MAEAKAATVGRRAYAPPPPPPPTTTAAGSRKGEKRRRFTMMAVDGWSDAKTTRQGPAPPPPPPPPPPGNVVIVGVTALTHRRRGILLHDEDDADARVPRRVDSECWRGVGARAAAATTTTPIFFFREKKKVTRTFWGLLVCPLETRPLSACGARVAPPSDERLCSTNNETTCRFFLSSLFVGCVVVYCLVCVPARAPLALSLSILFFSAAKPPSGLAGVKYPKPRRLSAPSCSFASFFCLPHPRRLFFGSLPFFAFAARECGGEAGAQVDELV